MEALKRIYIKSWEMYCPDTKCRGNAISIGADETKSEGNCPWCGKKMRNRRHVQALRP